MSEKKILIIKEDFFIGIPVNQGDIVQIMPKQRFIFLKTQNLHHYGSTWQCSEYQLKQHSYSDFEIFNLKTI